MDPPKGAGLSEDAESHGGSPMVIGGRRVQGPPIANVLAVFREPRSAHDELARHSLAEIADIERAAMRLPLDDHPGEPDYNSSKAVIESLDDFPGRFYSIPTSKGWAYYAIVAEGRLVASGWDATLDQGITLHFDEDPTGARLLVFGHLDDDVVRVTINSAQGAHPAQVGRNAFFVQCRRGVGFQDIREVVLAYRDGHTTQIPIAS